VLVEGRAEVGVADTEVIVVLTPTAAVEVEATRIQGFVVHGGVILLPGKAQEGAHDLAERLIERQAIAEKMLFFLADRIEKPRDSR